MNSCGAIVTYIDWKKVKKWFFNIPLFIYQLILIVVGTVWGKFKWGKASLETRVVSLIGAIGGAVGGFGLLMAGWPLLPYVGFIASVINIANYHGIPWRRVWRAAQASHVRLCLEKHPVGELWTYINFGYPKVQMQVWRPDMIDNKRFRYYDPTFEPSPEFIAAMIEYAEAQVGKGYDDLQLISNGLHLIAWIVWPWCWGKEFKVIKMFNRKGGREHCISGVTACLRWADVRKDCSAIITARVLENDSWAIPTRFFPGYSTATTSPCLVELSENWEER